jgi:hypothetical protein
MASDTSNSSAFKASLRLSLHAHAEKALQVPLPAAL